MDSVRGADTTKIRQKQTSWLKSINMNQQSNMLKRLAKMKNTHIAIDTAPPQGGFFVSVGYYSHGYL